MRRSHVAVLVVAGLLLASCRDTKTSGNLPTAPTLTPGARSNSIQPGSCTTLSALHALTDTVFGAGSPNANSVHGKLDNLQHQLDIGDLVKARAQAFNITDFILKKFKEGGLPGSAEEVVRLVNGVFCYAGLSISITDPANSSLVFPSDTALTIVSSTGTSGTQLPDSAVTEPVVLEITPLPSGDALDTRLDKFPGFITITMSSETNAGLQHPVVVAVCPTLPPGTPSEVRARLRLGHQTSGGFEITPPANASFLQCPPTALGQSRMPGWMKWVASLVLPKTLYARKQSEFSGGVGGTAGEFSPFGPVDPELSFSGGVGGTAGEFKKTPAPRTLGPRAPVRSSPLAPSTLLRPGAPGSRLTTVVDGVCTAVEAPWGMPLEPECRPGVVIRTHLGTILTNVPVAWAVTSGGGSIAAETSGTQACGSFGSSASTTTDANGKAGVCWTLGSAPGANTVSATPTVGGDAPDGVTFVPASANFPATAIKRTPVATAVGETVTYDGLDHPGSGSCSDGLTPALSYSGDGSVPRNAGEYTLTVTCGDNNVLYNDASATATITITPAPTTTTVSCPTSVLYTGSPQTPCTATVTGPGGLDQPVTPVTYTSNIVGTATASASYPGGGNYLGSTGSATFQILYVQVGCFASPIYSEMPSTKSYQRKGSNLPVKCSLKTASGAGVLNAHGNLLVEDKGTNPTGPASPTLGIAFQKDDAFKVSGSGNYSYGLDTSLGTFITLHFYYVTATWTDGSKTRGWFYIK